MNTTLKYTTHDRKVFFDIAAEYITPGSAVLDAGCGDGSFARHIGRPDIHMLDASLTNYRTFLKEFPNAMLGDVTYLPYEADSFDVIHASHIIEHLTPDQVYSFLQGCKKCLRPGGMLIISAPLMWHGFWDDMSHVRPYNPEVIKSYLSGIQNNHTRDVLGGFTEVRLQYRYCAVPDIILPDGTGTPSNQITKSGYTLVMKKEAVNG